MKRPQLLLVVMVVLSKIPSVSLAAAAFGTSDAAAASLFDVTRQSNGKDFSFQVKCAEDKLKRLSEIAEKFCDAFTECLREIETLREDARHVLGDNGVEILSSDVSNR